MTMRKSSVLTGVLPAAFSFCHAGKISVSTDSESERMTLMISNWGGDHVKTQLRRPKWGRTNVIAFKLGTACFRDPSNSCRSHAILMSYSFAPPGPGWCVCKSYVYEAEVSERMTGLPCREPYS